MHTHKILNIPSINTQLQNSISKELGISKVLSQILINRGIENADEAEKFLKPKLDYLLDPYSFSDMHKAVKLIRQAALRKEKVMICGDYDVDGITALALLKSTLSKMKVDAAHYLPHRIKDGYGLNKNVIHLAKQRGIRLLITVDCGTANHEQIQELRRHNIDVIITDHHEPLDSNLPKATVIINPKLKDSTYKYSHLAGVGVAYKLCQAITNDMLLEDLDLVSLGTIGDVVPLTGENRIMVKEGLRRLNKTDKAGLRALIENSGIKDKQINSYFVSFILGPRINASGRVDTAEVSLNLLLSKKAIEAEKLAHIIESHNRQRQKIEKEILEEAQDLVEKEINFKEHKIIVIAKDNWHPGVLGIIASKLADRFYRPTIVISSGEDLCRGSCRSIKSFHLFEALSKCKDLLKSFGGHSHAAGLVIAKNNIEDFKKSINLFAQEKLGLEDLLPSLDIDIKLSLSDLNKKILAELDKLEPFGKGNPEPLFYTQNLRLKGNAQVLGKNTLKFWVSDNDTTYQAIGFGMGGFKDSLVNADSFDLVYNPRIDNWENEGNIILEARDIFFR